MADVFISHVEEDSSVATQLSDGLNDIGFSTWLYERDILPGLSYLVQRGDAIKTCKAFLLLITPRSIGSYQVGAEVVRAFEQERPFLPLRQDISHADLQRRQPAWRQAIGSSASIVIDSGDIDSAVRRLAAGLRLLSIHPERAEEQEYLRSSLSVGSSARYDVFISGHRRHQELVGRLAAYLRTFGISVFSPLVPSGASDLARQTDEALDSARILVVVGKSPEDLDSSWTQYEWMSFRNEMLSGRKQDGAIVSLLLDLGPESLPLGLRTFHSLRCNPNEPDEAFAALREIIGAGRRWTPPNAQQID
jgi:hypothetical protein